jgi:hypothetical protein
MVETIQKSTNIFRVMQAKGLQGGKRSSGRKGGKEERKKGRKEWWKGGVSKGLSKGGMVEWLYGGMDGKYKHLQGHASKRSSGRKGGKEERRKGMMERWSEHGIE